MIRRPPRSTLFPTRRSSDLPIKDAAILARSDDPAFRLAWRHRHRDRGCACARRDRSEEHTSELQSQSNLVCRLLLEKKKKDKSTTAPSTHELTRAPS